MTSSRTLPVLMLSSAYLSYQHDDPTIQARWKHHVAVMLSLMPASAWEIALIFPINDKVAEMGQELTKLKKDDFADGRDAKVEELFTRWQTFHVFRIVAPMVATALLAGSALNVLPF